STLLLNMVLHDIAEGRGVTLLDPHGSLIDDVLKRLPRNRIDDVVVVDPSQIGRAVPLNPLHIVDTDPELYCATRDRIIDELLDVFDAQYDLKATGGPIFEHYFRTFFALLMGSERPTDYLPVLPMIDVIM